MTNQDGGAQRTTKDVTEPLFKLANRTPFNIAPERGEKLATEIFGDRNWSLHFVDKKATFYAIPGEATIHLSSGGLASIWCIAYAAFHIMDIASRARRDAAIGQTFIDIGQQYATLRIADYINYARELFRSNSAWLPQLNEPRTGPELSEEEKRVNNVFFGALSWILLHEIAHVHHKDEALIPADQLIRQEYLADDFATKWVLEDAGNGLQREFRVLMISVALTWLLLNEQILGRDSIHPPAFNRFREAAEQFCMRERSAALENATYLFKAVFDPQGEVPIFDTPAEAFADISKRLEKIFSE